MAYLGSKDDNLDILNIIAHIPNLERMNITCSSDAKVSRTAGSVVSGGVR